MDQDDAAAGGGRSHPDNHAGLVDWPLFGPRDPAIAGLVEQLAYEHGLRLAEIEDAIMAALTALRDRHAGGDVGSAPRA